MLWKIYQKHLSISTPGSSTKTENIWNIAFRSVFSPSGLNVHVYPYVDTETPVGANIPSVHAYSKNKGKIYVRYFSMAL